MTDPPSGLPDLAEANRTETTIRQFDADGVVVAETVTVITRRERHPGDLPTGMYL